MSFLDQIRGTSQTPTPKVENCDSRLKSLKVENMRLKSRLKACQDSQGNTAAPVARSTSPKPKPKPRGFVPSGEDANNFMAQLARRRKLSGSGSYKNKYIDEKMKYLTLRDSLIA